MTDRLREIRERWHGVKIWTDAAGAGLWRWGYLEGSRQLEDDDVGWAPADIAWLVQEVERLREVVMKFEAEDRCGGALESRDFCYGKHHGRSCSRSRFVKTRKAIARLRAKEGGDE